MYIIGKASESEIAVMIEQGWEVEEVNQGLFNASLNPKYDPKQDIDLTEEYEDGEKLICVYTDQDVDKELTKWYNEE